MLTHAHTQTHRHTDTLHCVTQCTLMILIVSVGANSPPHHAESRCYLGWQNTQGLSLLLLSSDISVWSISVPASLCLQRSATDVSPCTKQMRDVGDECSPQNLTANQQHLNNDVAFFSYFTRLCFPPQLLLQNRSDNKTMDV